MAIIGVIPAAGQATRLQPLQGSKEMLSIGGRPVMDYLVERMRAGGCTTLRVVTRPEKTDVIAHADEIGAEVVLGNPTSVSASFVAGMAELPDDDIVLIGFPDTIWEPVDGYGPSSPPFATAPTQHLVCSESIPQISCAQTSWSSTTTGSRDRRQASGTPLRLHLGLRGSAFAHVGRSAASRVARWLPRPPLSRRRRCARCRAIGRVARHRDARWAATRAGLRLVVVE